MHREISHTDDRFQAESRLSLYGLTGLLGVLLLLDLWPVLVRWLATWAGAWTTTLPTWPNEIGGYRLPRGSQLALLQWVVHRDPRWYDDPEAFRPERRPMSGRFEIERRHRL